MKRLTRDANTQAPPVDSGEAPKGSKKGGPERVHEITTSPLEQSDAMTTRPKKRRRPNADKEDLSFRRQVQEPTAPAVPVSSIPPPPQVARPDDSTDNRLRIGHLAPLCNFSTGFFQGIPLSWPSLQQYIGSFLWEGLLSSQERLIGLTPSTTTHEPAAFLYLPRSEPLDFGLGLVVSSLIGEAVKQAARRSFEALLPLLGQTLYEGARNSQTYVENATKSDNEARVDTVQVFDNDDGSCTIICFLEFRTGAMLATTGVPT